MVEKNKNKSRRNNKPTNYVESDKHKMPYYKRERMKTHAINIGTGLVIGSILGGITKYSLNKIKEEERNEKIKKKENGKKSKD